MEGTEENKEATIEEKERTHRGLKREEMKKGYSTRDVRK